MGKRILLSTLILLAVACAKAPVAEWTEGEAGEDGRALNVLVLNNVPAGSRVWFQEIFDEREIVEGPEIVHYQGTSCYIDIHESGTVTIKYYGRPLPRYSWAPEGFVLQQKGRKDRPMEVKYNFLDHPKEVVQFEASYEVPKGAWENRDRHEMKEIFTLGMVQLAQERGIRLMGWEDMTTGLSEETLSKLLESLYAVNVWHTDGVEGVPVILSPAKYTYMDLAYGLDANDIGLTWAGTIDEKKAFSLNPEDFAGNVLGVQAQLWSENVRSLDDATYQLLPKALGVAERAWNSKADDDFNRFNSIIKTREIPAWEEAGYNYKKR